MAKRFAKHIPGWVEAIRYARMDLSGWPETTSYARPPEATVAMLAMNAGRRLHLRVTLIAHGLLPRVMRSDPRPGCVSTAIVSARRDAEETGPSLTAGRRPREPPTAAPRRCVESGSCPEPEDPWCRFGFRCKLNCTKCFAGIAGNHSVNPSRALALSAADG